MIGHVTVGRWAVLAATGCLLAAFVTGASAAGRVDPSFAPGPAVAGHLLALGDFNGDGKSDFAVGNRSKVVTILLGEGTGAFSAAPGPGTTVGHPQSAATTDFNGDGKADLAVVLDESNAVAVLLGDGAGGFSAAPGSPVRGPDKVIAADLNGDGFADLAVTVYDDPTWRIAILLGDGSGRFSPAHGSPIAVGKQFAAFAVADFDGDGKPDIALTGLGSNKVSILLGVGGGEFRAGSKVSAAKDPNCLVVVDLNADGKPDLAVGSYSHDVTVLLGNGAGGFRVAGGSPIDIGSLYEAGSGRDPADIEAADFNGDRKLDLAVANEDSNTVVVLLGNGTGRFRPAAYSPFPLVSPYAVTAADLNGDGKADLAVSAQGLTILWQTPAAPVAVRGSRLPGRPDALVSTRWPITKLAADANRVAAKTAEPKKECGEEAVVWTAPGRESKSFKTTINTFDCSYACESGAACVELALGAGQVAWIARTGGNSLELRVVAAKLTGGATKEIDYAINGNGAGFDPDGDYVGQLFGEGSVLVFNRWTVCDPNNPESPGKSCPRKDPATGLAKEKLIRVVGGRPVVVKSGAGSYRLVAVGGGRMAVESAGGAVTVLGPSGTRVAGVPALADNPPRAVTLSRTQLAVERTFTLDLYRPATGTKKRSLALGPAAPFELTSVNAKLALLRGPRRLVLVRLSDGKLISLPLRTSTAASLVDARLTEAGLFYAYNKPKAAMKGRIVFEPTAKLLTRF
jgi:hypothetical protein